MELQSNYSDNTSLPSKGTVENGETSNRITRTCQPSTGIEFGEPAFEGSEPHFCSTTGTLFLGVTIATPSQSPYGGGIDTYRQYDNVNIATRGVIWIEPAVDVSVGEPVYIEAGAGFTNIATDNIAATGWLFDGEAVAGTPVRIARRG